MLLSIQPVLSSFRFGLADTLKIELQSDNLTDSAFFMVRLGKKVDMPSPGPLSGAGFHADESSAQHVGLSGEDYLGWDGSNAAVPALILPQLPAGIVVVPAEEPEA